MGQAGHFGVGAFDDALLGFLQRAGDADLLVNRDVDLLLGNPAVLVLEDVQRRLGVAVGRRVVQRLGRHELAVGAALHLGQLYQRVELLQPAVLAGRQAGAHGERVTFKTIAGRFIDCL